MKVVIVPSQAARTSFSIGQGAAVEESLRIASLPTRRELVAERLRTEIVTGRFAPGSRLIERELCELMGVSRTSVREALRELEAEGLVTVVPHKGPIVSVVSEEVARDVYQVRVVLEGLAARLFARHASDAQMKALDEALGALEIASRAQATVQILAAKTRFYDVLLDGAGNQVAMGMLRTIHSRVSQLRATSLADPARARSSLREIRTFVKALKRRDEEAAWEACVAHIENAAQAALATIRGFAAPPVRRSPRKV